MDFKSTRNSSKVEVTSDALSTFNIGNNNDSTAQKRLYVNIEYILEPDNEPPLIAMH